MFVPLFCYIHKYVYMYLLDSDVCPALIYNILYVGSCFCLYGHGIFVFVYMVMVHLCFVQCIIILINISQFVIFMSGCIKNCIFTKGIIVILIVRELDLHLPMQ